MAHVSAACFANGLERSTACEPLSAPIAAFCTTSRALSRACVTMDASIDDAPSITSP